MDKLIGTVLDGRYIIREIIGTGGMSIVYRAEDVLEDRCDNRREALLERLKDLREKGQDDAD